MSLISNFALALPNACLLSWGWRRRLLAVAIGALSAFALPPYGWYPVLFVTFPAFVWLLDGAVQLDRDRSWGRLRAGFAVGWLFGFGYFLSGLWWIGSAFLVEADRFAWMIPFAVLAMPVGLAMFTGVAGAIAARFWSGRPDRIVLLAGTFAAADWLRGHILTGFPWNAFGYAFSGSLVLAQTASVVGLYGLGFLVVFVCAAPAVLLDRSSRLARSALLMAALAALVAMVSFGVLRLNVFPDPALSETDVRIVQPSIDQAEKWKPENRARIFQTYLDQSQQPLSGTARVGQPRVVVWPESAIPFLLTREPEALFKIGAMLPDNSSFVTGAVRVEETGSGRAFYNSVYLVDTDGMVLDVYDKVRLVPFGEYLPFEKALSSIGLTALVDTPSPFEAGFRQRVMMPPSGSGFLPLICYEAIFPGLSQATSISSANGELQWLLNVTNDAWFGRTPGPYQHFAQARLRAIEQGLPLVRAANTGISAVVDAKGRVLQNLALFEVGIVDAAIPGRLPSTLYGRFGDALLVVMLLLSAGLLLVDRYNRGSRYN